MFATYNPPKQPIRISLQKDIKVKPFFDVLPTTRFFLLPFPPSLLLSLNVIRPTPRKKEEEQLILPSVQSGLSWPWLDHEGSFPLRNLIDRRSNIVLC